MKRMGLALALAAPLLMAQAAWAQNALVFEYHGWRVDLTGARGVAPDRQMVDAVKRQLDIVENVKLKPAMVQFMRTIKIWAEPANERFGPGHYARAKGVDLRVRALDPTKPIILHELLHAYHDQQLPGGFGNSDVNKFYDHAKTAGWPADSYMLSNSHEFFATTASVYLFGNIPRPPNSRNELRTKQPRYYEWLAALFDDGQPRK